MLLGIPRLRHAWLSPRMPLKKKPWGGSLLGYLTPSRATHAASHNGGASAPAGGDMALTKSDMWDLLQSFNVKLCQELRQDLNKASSTFVLT